MYLTNIIICYNLKYPNKEKGNDEVNVEFSVSNIVENAGEFAHLPKSFVVNRNNSDLASEVFTVPNSSPVQPFLLYTLAVTFLN